MRTANPALSDKTFERYVDYAAEARMTLSGTVNKTGFLLLILMVPAVWIWRQVYEASGAVNVQGWMIGGIFGGLVMAMVTVFKPTWSPITAPMYAALEGLALGGISAFFEQRYPGIVIQAIALTFGTLAVLLTAYATGVIKATENFKLGVASATGAVFLVYMTTMVMGFFGISVPYIHEGGLIGIIFSLVVVVIAALNLVLDFDFIETGVERGAPKFMEWYAAFGLMVTLVWLYLEILRLLAKLQSRR
ncbi:MAG: Bax inhibitor-1/YccA family protein [Gemmatimonadales bacterium]